MPPRPLTALLFGLLVMVLLTDMTYVSGQPIVQRIVEKEHQKLRKLGAELGGQSDYVPIEQCRIKQLNEPLAVKMVHLCNDCERAFGIPNFNMQCRANCFENPIFASCSVAMLQSNLNEELKKFNNVVSFKDLFSKPEAMTERDLRLTALLMSFGKK